LVNVRKQKAASDSFPKRGGERRSENSSSGREVKNLFLTKRKRGGRLRSMNKKSGMVYRTLDLKQMPSFKGEGKADGLTRGEKQDLPASGKKKKAPFLEYVKNSRH